MNRQIKDIAKVEREVGYLPAAYFPLASLVARLKRTKTVLQLAVLANGLAFLALFTYLAVTAGDTPATIAWSVGTALLVAFNIHVLARSDR